MRLLKQYPSIKTNNCSILVKILVSILLTTTKVLYIIVEIEELILKKLSNKYSIEDFKKH